MVYLRAGCRNAATPKRPCAAPVCLDLQEPSHTQGSVRRAVQELQSQPAVSEHRLKRQRPQSAFGPRAKENPTHRPVDRAIPPDPKITGRYAASSNLSIVL